MTDHSSDGGRGNSNVPAQDLFALTGLVGAGRTSLARALFGAIRTSGRHGSARTRVPENTASLTSTIGNLLRQEQQDAIRQGRRPMAARFPVGNDETVARPDLKRLTLEFQRKPPLQEISSVPRSAPFRMLQTLLKLDDT